MVKNVAAPQLQAQAGSKLRQLQVVFSDHGDRVVITVLSSLLCLFIFPLLHLLPSDANTVPITLINSDNNSAYSRMYKFGISTCSIMLLCIQSIKVLLLWDIVGYRGLSTGPTVLSLGSSVNLTIRRGNIQGAQEVM